MPTVEEVPDDPDTDIPQVSPAASYPVSQSLALSVSRSVNQLIG